MIYKFFFTPMCPNCAKVAEFLKTAELAGEAVDCSVDSGLEVAKKCRVSAVPAVLFFENNESKKPMATAHNVDEIKNIVSNRHLM